MNLSTPAAIAALLFSTAAAADIEAGAHAGYTSMGMDGADEAFTGPAFGARVGMGVGLGLTPEINVTRYSGTMSAGDVETAFTQLQAGFGARFYIGDFFLRPFASGHLNYAMEGETTFDVAGQSTSSAVPGTSGMGFDFGGGLQIKFLDLIYTELQGTYSRTMNDAAISNVYAGLGAGVKL